MAITRTQLTKMRSRQFYLPEDLLFKILVLVPAEVLHDAARHVCKQWYAIINSPAFIQAHHRLSNASLLVQKHYVPHCDSVLVEFPGKDDITVKRFEYTLPGKILTSCDGLVLMSNNNIVLYLFVVNPVTRRLWTLPPPPSRYIFKEKYSGLVRSPVSNKFKILTVAHQRLPTGYMNKYMILTAGVDTSWRFVDPRQMHISKCLNPPTFARGFVYWINSSTLFVMDVETEVVQEFSFSLPQEMQKICRRSVLPMGDSLSVILEFSELKWDVWKLNDSRNGRWTKLYAIDLEDQRERLTLRFGFKEPKVWWNNGEWLVFEMHRGCRRPLVYNVQTGENYSLNNINYSGGVHYHEHVSSLISWKDC